MQARPSTLKEIAEWSESITDFGWNLRDWLHELRKVSSRDEAAAAIVSEPERLREKFTQGNIADAWLAAYAEHLAISLGIAPPSWASAPWRILNEPSFDEGASTALREHALLGSPPAFRRRNIFTPSVDLPLPLSLRREAR